MASRLTDPYLKLSRAKEHIDSLAVELRAFYESKPYGFTSYEDIENARYILRAKLSEVPDKIPLILGDAVNCMRASLDQLVWSLAKLTTVIPNKTQFPIHDKSDAKSRKVFKRDLRGVPPDAVREIDSFQPYKRTTGVQSHPDSLVTYASQLPSGENIAADSANGVWRKGRGLRSPSGGSTQMSRSVSG